MVFSVPLKVGGFHDTCALLEGIQHSLTTSTSLDELPRLPLCLKKIKNHLSTATISYSFWTGRSIYVMTPEHEKISLDKLTHKLEKITEALCFDPFVSTRKQLRTPFLLSPQLRLHLLAIDQIINEMKDEKRQLSWIEIVIGWLQQFLYSNSFSCYFKNSVKKNCDPLTCYPSTVITHFISIEDQKKISFSQDGTMAYLSRTAAKNLAEKEINIAHEFHGDL